MLYDGEVLVSIIMQLTTNFSKVHCSPLPPKAQISWRQRTSKFRGGDTRKFDTLSQVFRSQIDDQNNEIGEQAEIIRSYTLEMLILKFFGNRLGSPLTSQPKDDQLAGERSGKPRALISLNAFELKDFFTFTQRSNHVLGLIRTIQSTPSFNLRLDAFQLKLKGFSWKMRFTSIFTYQRLYLLCLLFALINRWRQKTFLALF